LEGSFGIDFVPVTDAGILRDLKVTFWPLQIRGRPRPGTYDAAWSCISIHSCDNRVMLRLRKSSAFLFI